MQISLAFNAYTYTNYASIKGRQKISVKMYLKIVIYNQARKKERESKKVILIVLFVLHEENK